MIKYRIVNWKFNRVRLSQEIVYAINMRGITQDELSGISGISATTIMELREGTNKNPEMKTLLAVINALDLDVRDYFELDD